MVSYVLMVYMASKLKHNRDMQNGLKDMLCLSSGQVKCLVSPHLPFEHGILHAAVLLVTLADNVA